MRHTISVLVENQFGVLARVAGLFSGRGFNIESLTVAETLDPQVSRLTLVTRGDDQVLAQVTQQLNKLINVIKVIDFIDASHVKRELALIKVKANRENRTEVSQIIEIFRGHRDSWEMAYWFASANSFLGAKRPQDLFAKAPQRVIAAAEDEVQGIVHG